METPTATTATTAPAWAVIELMGHVRYGGRVSKDTQFGTAMLRVDVPQKDGAFVTQLINPSSLYRLTICSEEIARAAASQGDSEPMQAWELNRGLPKAKTSDPEQIGWAEELGLGDGT